MHFLLCGICTSQQSSRCLGNWCRHREHCSTIDRGCQIGGYLDTRESPCRQHCLSRMTGNCRCRAQQDTFATPGDWRCVHEGVCRCADSQMPASKSFTATTRDTRMHLPLAGTPCQNNWCLACASPGKHAVQAATCSQGVAIHVLLSTCR